DPAQTSDTIRYLLETCADQAACAQRRTDRAGDVRAPFAPVEAGPAERPLPFRGSKVNTERREQHHTLVHDLTTVLVEHDVSAFNKRVRHGDAQLARDVILP